MMTKLPVSVVIVTYNTGSVLKDAIDTVLSSKVSQLVLVNNGNPESEFQPVRQLIACDPRCLLVEGQGNIGYGAAVNLGVSKALQPQLMILNPDISAELGMLEAWFEAHVSLASPAVSGAWVTDMSGDVQRGTCRNLLTPVSLFIDAFKLNCHIKHLNRWALNRTDIKDFSHSNSSPMPVSAVNGACLLMPTDLFLSAGGFDEQFFLHFEDLDLFKRLFPIPLYLHVNCLFKHEKSSSDIGKSTLYSLKYRAFCQYFRKHYPLFWYSPIGWGVNLIFKVFKHKLFS